MFSFSSPLSMERMDKLNHWYARNGKVHRYYLQNLISYAFEHHLSLREILLNCLFFGSLLKPAYPFLFCLFLSWRKCQSVYKSLNNLVVGVSLSSPCPCPSPPSSPSCGKAVGVQLFKIISCVTHFKMLSHVALTFPRGQNCWRDYF